MQGIPNLYTFPVTVTTRGVFARNSAESVLFGGMPHRQDVQVRIRKRIRARLDELGMTARELARACGNTDGWISGVLAGAHGLHWKDFDKVADTLGLSPSELVRHDDDELRELTPTQMRLLRHYQAWPVSMQQRWLDLLDHFSATSLDPETGAFLERIRAIPKSLRRPVLDWLGRLLEEGTQPEPPPGVGDLAAIAKWLGPDSTLRTPSERTRRGARGHGDHQT